jgi:hypothetical protein
VPDLSQYVSVESGDLIIPIPREKVMNLFGWLSIDTDLPKKRKSPKQKDGEHHQRKTRRMRMTPLRRPIW